MRWKIKTRFLPIFLLISFALSLFSFTTPPALAATTNLGPMPYYWEQWGGGLGRFLFIDKAVTRNGHPSLRMQADYGTGSARDGFIKDTETTSQWIPIKPGDRIVFLCWMKLNAGDGIWNYGGPDFSGSRLGIDFYDDIGLIGDTSALNGNPYQTSEETTAAYVNWGETWTLRKMEFTVRSTYSDLSGARGPRRPTGMIPWIQTLPKRNTGYAWFADSELYINPTIYPSQTSFNEGFESGSLSAWTTTYTSAGATATVRSSTRFKGAYSLDSNLPAADRAHAVAVKTFANSYSTIFARAYVRFSALPTSGNRFLLSPTICDVDNHDLVAVYIRNNADTYEWALRYKTNTGIGWVYSSTPTPTIDTWYCLEIKFVGASGTGEARLWVNGVERASITGLTNNNFLAQQVQVGAYSASALAFHVYTDSVVSDIRYIGMETEAPINTAIARDQPMTIDIIQWE